MTRTMPVARKAATITVFLLAGTVSTATPATAAPATAIPAVPTAMLTAVPRTDVAAALRALETSFKGRIGAYAIDTATGKTVGYRAGQRFALLSTFKAVAAGAVLAKTTDRELTRKVVHWTAGEVKPNSPETSKHVKDGMTLAELCRAAIIYSDNTAGNMLLKRIGGPRGLTRYFRTLKDPLSRLDRWETELNDWSPKEKRDTTTPASVARDLRALTTGGALGAKDRSRLIGWLRGNTTGDARIRAGLPKTWIVGDKTGTGGAYGAANDVAVVWPAKGSAPIIMAISTNRRAAAGSTDDKVIAKTATVLARGLGRLP
ncbi:class A beta-lactamase [Microbispora bryophytorum]|uniref:class A beta-lactamase n=1 Tax=Microbispora bryophytorum TaxID=1460882 RepID=UPI0033D8E15C